MLQLRQPVRRNTQRQSILRDATVLAPVKGWDSSSAQASKPAGYAEQLKNWFPQPGYVEVRKGYRWHAWDLGSDPVTVTPNASTNVFAATGHGMTAGTAVKVHAVTTLPAGLSATRIYYLITVNANDFQLSTVAGGSAVDITTTGSGTVRVYKVDEPTVETLPIWQGPSSSKMFAAAGNAIWDITSAGAATYSYSTGVSVDRWQWCMHTTSAGNYLFMVNGTDAPIHYNGTTWAVPTINVITESEAIGVISHKKRIWFVIRDSTKGAYMPTEAVAGDGAYFEFGSLFTKGGYLLALATWTRDGGAGADDYLVAISSRGQVALYQGTDPASANTWALVGVFDVPTPIGRRCFQKFGGDLLLTTVEGVFPLSQLLAVDQSSAGRLAITDKISEAFNKRALSYQSLFGWEIATYAKGTRLIVNIPTAESVSAIQYVMNTLTGAWCEFDNHNANTWAVYNDNLFFAGNEGDVYQADYGRADIDTPIVAVGQTAYEAYKSARTKRFSKLRPLITATGSNRPSVGISTDFVETQNLSAITASTGSSGSVWDGAGLTWDQAGLTWGGGEVQATDWADVTGLGTFGSVKFRAVTGTQSGGALWDVAQWGSSLWGSQAQSDETMRIQGFLVLYEVGGQL